MAGGLTAGIAEQPGALLPAVCGIWVLQQAAGREELARLLPSTLAPALRTPHIRGFSLRVPWNAIAARFDLLDAGLEIARSHHVAFSVRFMAGRHTPAPVFERGSPFYLRAGSQEKVPAPVMGNGMPNSIFEEAYEAHVERLARWCRKNGVHLLHLAWYGQDWAELNHGKEVRALPGYSYANWLRAHTRLIDVGLRHAGDDLAVELPFSGHGPLTDAAVSFADHVIAKIGPNNPQFFCQANGWGPNGEWGAPNAETEAAFDRVWEKPVLRGLQMIQPQDYDWPKVFSRLYETKAVYGEVYAPSFLKPNKKLLAEEVRKFSAYCENKIPFR
ncbi:MAG: hypothetical protein N3D11_12395 [Candidatus Sumerlaeia bacterium]|nr:hypothetical protein [Candidatus Sumerlaeia bacterium]